MFDKQDRVRTLLSDLELVLDQIRYALINGLHSDLPALSSRQESLLEYLLKTGAVSSDDWRRVNALARRNARLIHAALDGVASVRTRLRDIETAQYSVTGYSPDGKRFTPEPATRSVEKRL